MTSTMRDRLTPAYILVGLVVLAAVAVIGLTHSSRPEPPPYTTPVTDDMLQPYYPSPYADKGWVYGSDCRWTSGPADWDFIIGACRYSPNAHAANSKGAQGWAEVRWHKWDLVPMSAVPCSVRGDKPDMPQCLFEVKSIPSPDKQD